MGVPYSDAWGIPVDMALDMLGISPNNAKSKQPNGDKVLPPSLVNHQNKAAITNPRKQVAVRRKSKTTS